MVLFRRRERDLRPGAFRFAETHIEMHICSTIFVLPAEAAAARAERPSGELEQGPSLVKICKSTEENQEMLCKFLLE